jgi:hypothetical protein
MRARIAARVLMDHQLVVLFPEVLRQARVMHAVVVDVVDVLVKVLKERDARWVFGRRVGTDEREGSNCKAERCTSMGRREKCTAMGRWEKCTAMGRWERCTAMGRWERCTAMGRWGRVYV